MQLIKSIRSFGRWLFNIKDEVKEGDVFAHKNLNIMKSHVIKVDENFVYYRYSGTITTMQLPIDVFKTRYRKIS